ncbi:MAG: hypothetical protein ACE5GA_05615 [Candidatus Zixiibacteriota bacterium]
MFLHGRADRLRRRWLALAGAGWRWLAPGGGKLYYLRMLALAHPIAE